MFHKYYPDRGLCELARIIISISNTFFMGCLMRRILL